MKNQVQEALLRRRSTLRATQLAEEEQQRRIQEEAKAIMQSDFVRSMNQKLANDLSERERYFL